MAASVNLAILIGFVTVAGLVALSINALMNASWRRPREMSPSLSACRSRTKASACSPLRSFQPFVMATGPALPELARLLGEHADPAHGIRHGLEALEVGLRDVVDPDLEQVLHGLDEQRLSAIGVGGVDLVLAVARDVDVEVAREVDHVDRLAVRGDVNEHDDVGAAGVTGPRVCAHDQEVGAVAGLGHGGAVGCRHRGTVLRQQRLVGDVVIDGVAQVANEPRCTRDEQEDEC